MSSISRDLKSHFFLRLTSRVLVHFLTMCHFANWDLLYILKYKVNQVLSAPFNDKKFWAIFSNRRGFSSNFEIVDKRQNCNFFFKETFISVVNFYLLQFMVFFINLLQLLWLEGEMSWPIFFSVFEGFGFFIVSEIY